MEAIAGGGKICLNNSCSFGAGVEVDRRLYFSARDRNGLYAIEYETQKVRFLGFFQVKSEHDFCCRLGNNLWFFPMECSRNQIDVYHMDSGQFSTINIPCPDNKLLSTYGKKFVAMLEYESNKYIIPGTYDYVIKVNQNNCIADYIKLPPEYLTGSEQKFADALIYKKHIYFCPYDSDYILKMALDSEECSPLKWNYSKGAYGKICEYQGKLYVLPSKTGVNIVSINDDFSGLLELPIHLETGNKEERYLSIGCIGGTAWFFPCYGNVINRLSLDKLETWQMKIVTEAVYRDSEMGYCASITGKDSLVFAGYGDGTPLAKVSEAGEISFFSFYIGVQENMEYLCVAIDKKVRNQDKSCIGSQIYQALAEGI